MTSPRVSVVIKSYNHAKYVRQTIQSVLDQSFQDFEIIVTDDASADGTAQVVQEFGDPRISLEVLDRNHGISLAMNATVRRANCEFIAILNSDDFALPDRLATQLAFLEANPRVSALFTLPLVVDESGEPTESFSDFTAPFSLPDFSRETWLRHFFFNGNCLCAPTAMIRRSAYRDAGWYDPRLTGLQDFDMWIRMLLKGHGFHVLPDALTAFRVRAGAKNASAPRRDVQIRTVFEYSQILRHYLTLRPDSVAAVFGSDIAAHGLATSDSPGRLLAELALTKLSIPHCLFAFNAMFETAETLDDLQRLRDVTGGLDLFSLVLISEQQALIADLTNALRERDAAIKVPA